MKKLLLLIILGALAWYGFGKYKDKTGFVAAPDDISTVAVAKVAPPVAPPQFTCDGRTHCSQMRSCAEAKYFIQHCPNTKMDGNGDGVPCERQWCN